ncbi:hypothetical protein OTU49_006149 [Cherax quadricarinatus]|uniref:Uncharacterized protein n=1 Tax=Cherax quadricarinatus TaxID=27406 RepID=A0AAW0X4L8_CHEQU
MRNYIHSDSKECQAHYSCEKLHCIPFVECSLLKITSTSLPGAVQNLHNTYFYYPMTFYLFTGPMFSHVENELFTFYGDNVKKIHQIFFQCSNPGLEFLYVDKIFIIIITQKHIINLYGSYSFKLTSFLKKKSM